MDNWNPIDSAPKDGRSILLFQPGAGMLFLEDDREEMGYIFVGYYEQGVWHCSEYEAFEKYPTHWQYLPEPPNG